MIIRVASIFALTGALASCADDPGKLYVDQLIDRFDVPECGGATMVRAGRNPDETKPGSNNVYAVNDHCIADMKHAFDVIGFEQIGTDRYRYISDQGWLELVQLSHANDQQKAGIIWETIEP